MKTKRKVSGRASQGFWALSLCCLAILCLCLGACKSPDPATAILVVVDGDQAAVSQLTHLELRAVERSSERALMEPYRVELDPEDASKRIPFSFALASPQTKDSDFFRVEAMGLKGDEEVVRQAAFVKFRRGVTQRLDLYFSQECLGSGKLCDPEDRATRVCGSDAGHCDAIPEYATLPVAGDDVLGGYVARGRSSGIWGGGQDGSTGQSDAGPSDARVDARSGLTDASADASTRDAASAVDGSGDTGVTTIEPAEDCSAVGCMHDGQCIESENGNLCACGDSGYDGPFCGENVNECQGANVCSGVSPSGAGFDYECEDTEPYYTCPGMFMDWRIEHSETRFETLKESGADSYDEVVADTLTGLEWLASAGGRPAGSWSEVDEFCAMSSAVGGGWRLPTLAELLSLPDYSKPMPIPGMPFHPGQSHQKLDHFDHLRVRRCGCRGSVISLRA